MSITKRVTRRGQLETVYVETSFVSYAASELGRDLVIAGMKQLSREWWKEQRGQFDVFTSQLVIEESAQGDSVEAAKRLDLLKAVPILEFRDEAETLASMLILKHGLPEGAVQDALHVAVAAIYGMDFLLTWNCKHIANPRMQDKIHSICSMAGYQCPMICTPLVLKGRRSR